MVQQTLPPKTSASTKTLESAKGAWPYQKEDYEFGSKWKAAGKPIAWSCSNFPKEIFFAMGVWPFFPEQFAAMFATRRRGDSRDPSVEKEAVRFCRMAEAEGFRDYMCGYARTALGYSLNSARLKDFTDAPRGGVPAPDMIVTTSHVCDIRMKWLEYTAQLFKVPFFTIDFPERAQDSIIASPGARTLMYPYSFTLKRGEKDFLTYMPADHDIEYMKAQIEDAIIFMEKVTGNKYDKDKFNEVMDISYKTNEVRQEILQLRKAVPAPMTSADGFASMYPGMYFVGTKRCLDFYTWQRDELREKVRQGIGAIPNERFRLLWYGLPLWFNMGIFNYFEKWGGVFAYEPSYNPFPHPPRNPDDPIKELAMRWLLAGGGLGAGLSSLVHDCREYKISGVVLSYLITCRPVAFPTTEIRRVLEEELGIPTIAIECDLVDERIFAQGQVETRLDAFAEQLLTKLGIPK